MYIWLDCQVVVVVAVHRAVATFGMIATVTLHGRCSAHASPAAVVLFVLAGCETETRLRRAASDIRSSRLSLLYR